MKKVFYIFGILAMGILASCQKDPVENTACVDMSGDWYVTIDAAKSGQVVYEDVYDLGYVHMFTSNTAANIATEMLLTDNRGGAQTPSGMPADAIEFYITFSDDEDGPAYGWDSFYIHGYRYTGFAGDE